MLYTAASGGASCVCEDGARYDSYSGSDRLSTLTDSSLLEARFKSENPLEQGRAIHDALRRLSRANASIELSLGEGLALLGRGGFDIAELGHSHFDSLCHGRYGFSGARGRELRTLHSKLRDLPLLRETFLAGLIPRTRMRAVIGIAQAEDEAGWARLAMQLTSRELRRRVRDVKAARQAGDGGACGLLDEDLEPDNLERVSWLGSRADKAMWEFLIVAIRQLLGKQASVAECAELLAAETLAGTAPVEWDEAEPAEPACRRSRARRAMQRVPRPSRRGLGKLLRALARAGHVGPDSDPGFAVPEESDFSTCDGAVDVHDVLVPLVRRLHAIECERSKLLAWMHGRCLYRPLGFRSFHEWLERTLGLGPRDAQRLLELHGRAEFMPALDEAWASGSLSTHQVSRVSQVAERETVGEWLRFAADVTAKHLDAAVAHCRVRADLVGARPVHGRPPWDAPYGRLLLDWQTQLGLRQREDRRSNRPGGACGSLAEPKDVPDLEEALRSQAGGLTRCRIGFRASPTVARMFREAIVAARTEFGAPLSDAEVIRLMAQQLLAVHVSPDVLAHARRHAIMERDGWCCVVPHCRSRGPLHAHHVRFRSRGGGDEAANLATVCEACHALIHAGKILMYGRAPGRLTVLLGTRREGFLGERRLRADEGWNPA